MSIYDVAIVGAGPAGTTLARLIGRTHRVLLIDRRPLARPAATADRGKCCGGLLAPDAQQVIGQMGLGLPQSVLVTPQLFMVRAMDLASGLERHYQRFYLNMDRERFDRWLLSLVPASVDLRDETHFAGYRETPQGCFELSLRRGEQHSYAETAQVLVGADGANSTIRRAVLPADAGHQAPAYVAVQEWYQAEQPLPYYTAIFDPAVTDFYAWTIPKGENLLLGAAIPRRAAVLERFQLLKTKLLAMGFDLGRPVKREGCLLLRPRGARDLTLGAGNLMLVGEAAGWISPSSAEGLSYAMRSALALAGAMNDAAASPEGLLARYRAAARGLAANLAGKQAKSLVMYDGRLRRLVMASGLTSSRAPTPAPASTRPT